MLTSESLTLPLTVAGTDSNSSADNSINSLDCDRRSKGDKTSFTSAKSKNKII